MSVSFAGLEKDAYEAVESYALPPDGTIDTTSTFRKGGFDGEKKRMTPRGFVRDRKSTSRAAAAPAP